MASDMSYDIAFLQVGYLPVPEMGMRHYTKPCTLRTTLVQTYGW